MKLIFNDASWLQIQNAEIKNDALCIKTISAKQETLVSLFSDQAKTKHMAVEENGVKIAEYDNYINFYGIMAHYGGILEPIMYRIGETVEEKIAKLEEENRLLSDCIIELSEEVYGMEA